MPRVPTYDNLQATPSTAPMVAIQAPSGPSGEALAADQIQRVGQAAQQAGGAMSAIAADAQREANDLRVNDAMTQLVDADTKLRVEALSLKGRNALDRPDGKSLPDEFGERLQQTRKEIAASLGNEAQRRAFDQAAVQQVARLHGAITQHMVAEQQTYQNESDRDALSVAQNRGVLLFGDENVRQQSVTAISRIVNSIANRMGMSPEAREAAMIESLSPLHAGVLKGMVQAGMASQAKAYYDENSANMTLQARAVASEAINLGVSRERAQAFGDEVMARGLSMTDALKAARERFSGKEEDEAVREVHGRFAEQEMARTRDAKATKDQAWAAVMESGKVPPDLLADLRQKAPEEERQIRDWQEAKWRRAKADAEGKATTDMDVYYGLRRMAMDDPSAFSQLDLRRSEPYLKDADLKHLIEVQSQISRGDAKAMESQRITKSTLAAIRAEVQAIGIDLTPKEGTAEAKKTAAFMGALTQSLDQATAAKGGPLTPDEAKRVGMGMVREGIEQGSGVFGVFQTHKRGYQIATDPSIAPGANFVLKRFADIPQEVRSRLTQEYRTANNLGTRPLTADQEAEIERAYTRGVQQGRFQ